ncbi:MAG: CDP-diacylglycerol--serine O-phosphatidyltransferase [bacterium]
MRERFSRGQGLQKRRLGGENIRKGIYILPNLFTSASLFAGFYSIVATLNGDFAHASWAIIVSMFCDGADGRIARMTSSTSRFGVEYDSLSDLVSFGVAPGLLAYQWALRPYGNWGWSAAFLFVVCGALRLARYNVQIDNIESVTFNGLPIPGSAGLVATTVLLYYKFQVTGPTKQLAVLLLIFLLAFLMVSNIKFLSFKELELRRRKPFTALLAIIVLLVLIVNEPQIVLFTLFTIYALHGPVRGIFLRMRRRRNAALPLEEEAGQAQGPTG